MKFTFDGNIYENNNSSKDLKSDQKFNFSGLIYESTIRTAGGPLPFEADARKFMAMNPTDRADFFVHTSIIHSDLRVGSSNKNDLTSLSNGKAASLVLDSKIRPERMIF